MLDWDMILETDDHKTILLEMYTREPLEELSERLGVAKLSLRAKLLKENIQLRPRGGVNPVTKVGKSRLDSLDPAIFMKLTPQEIARQWDMHPSAVYKYIRRHKLEYRRTREAIPRQSDNVQADEVSGSGDVGEREVGMGRDQQGEVFQGDVVEVNGTRIQQPDDVQDSGD